MSVLVLKWNNDFISQVDRSSVIHFWIFSLFSISFVPFLVINTFNDFLISV